MKVEFVKVNPSENMTIYITTPVEKELYSKIANQVMDYNSLNGEQVGYFEAPKLKNSKAAARLEMMGGEFCGNASRGFAAILADKKGYKHPTDIVIEASGADEPLTCHVTPLGGKSYDVSLKVPNAVSVKEVSIHCNNSPLDGMLVDLGGICHCVFLVKNTKRSKSYIKELLNLLPYDSYDAFGIMLYDPINQELLPAVYVRDTKSLFIERSCGSGTAAVGIVMSLLTRQDQALAVKQQGGVLNVQTTLVEDEISKVVLSGKVNIVAKGEVYL